MATNTSVSSRLLDPHFDQGRAMHTVLTPPSPPDAPPGVPTDRDTLYEVVGDQVEVLPPMGVREVLVASFLQRVMGTFTDREKLGTVVTEALFQLIAKPRLQRRPDLAFVSYRTWPADRSILDIETNAWHVIPDLAVEVVSPTDMAVEVLARVREYFDAGVSRVWLVFPTHQLVYDYESPTRVQISARPDTLVGDPVVPGFRLPLSELFGVEPTPPAGGAAPSP
jgi:Uma2 family endonuclease